MIGYDIYGYQGFALHCNPLEVGRLQVKCEMKFIKFGRHVLLQNGFV